MSAKILRFPQRQKQESPKLQDRLSDIDDTVDEIVPELLSLLTDAGYDVSGDMYVQDVALIIESMKAIMFRSEGMNHGLHKISDKINVSDFPIAANTAR